MAEHISPVVKARYQFPRLAQIHVKTKTARVRSKWRNYLRQVFPSSVRDADPGRPVVTQGLENSREKFLANRWAFTENFWEPNFHELLVEQWPPDRFFNPGRFVTKSYDTAFGFGSTNTGDLVHLSDFPAYQNAYAYLQSDKFCDRLTRLAGDGVRRVCYQVSLTRSYWGSNVIAHTDSHPFPGQLNFVLFVKGSGGDRSGGLGFWADNEFREKIFEPMNLCNTCAYYDMSKSFYHGFEPMRFGAYRWTINATYRPRNVR